jgi:hypothetical protein
MPGYAYPVGTVAETGTAKSVTVLVTDIGPSTLTTLFTAASKTKVNSVLATNTYGTILPVKLYVYRAANTATFLLTSARVLTNKYLVLPLVSGDARVNDVSDPEVNLYKVATEFVLQVGDIVKASCPIEDVVNVTLNLTEGVK